MFERNTINERQRARLRVLLVTTDETSRTGYLVAGMANSLRDILNSPHPFIEFEDADGEICFIAKALIKTVSETGVPKADQLQSRARSNERFDPYDVLGVPRVAEIDAIRVAYREKVKAYHPDRLKGLDLPTEMMDYAGTMMKRVNAAYSELRGLREVS